MLSYWSSDLDLEIAPWFPLGVDYNPVSINLFHSKQLERIAAACFERGSEFLFMSSPTLGCVGSLMRDNFFKVDPQIFLNLGFMMLLGYSPQMEALLGQALARTDLVRAGVAFCSLWSKRTLLEQIKVIVLVSEGIFFDEESFLTEFEALFASDAKEKSVYFAEKFGYRRFYVPYETDDLLQLRISRLLYEMEFPETRQMVGPSPEMPFPPFLGISLGIANITTL
ncbi:MAG: hypothetical protein GX256_03220 [Fretibacterium sp.]|nr:hypothetical protein [Fretibacterium sp.]